ncbi:MAG: right-handed parallel beta-helix repeat-containing protein [Phycisphaerae bacterium]
MRKLGLLAICALVGVTATVSPAQRRPAASYPASLPANPWPVTQPNVSPGEPVLEAPTLHCLGVYWVIAGDPEKKARVEVSYRQAGAEKWKAGMPLFRVQHGATWQLTHDAELIPPDDAWLFAGSIFGLTPDTQYEIRLKLVKADGTAVEKELKGRTIGEPKEPEKPRVLHVVPGKGGGSGTEKDPYQGLDYAQTDAQPGDIFLVHKGVYEGTFHAVRSGRPGRPVIWRGAGDGEAVIDGGGKAKTGIETTHVSDVWFEKLTIKGFHMGVLMLDSSDIVIRRCDIRQVQCGIYNYYRGDKEPSRGYFIADNTLEGSLLWGRDNRGAATEEWRGMQLTGIGHVICYNRIRQFKDGVDTFPSRYCCAIDIHNNEISECMDDGVEMDFSERNNRCFNNRLVNVHQGISEQPVFGGPVYVFRNALYNVLVEPFKLHHNGGPGYKIDWAPSGALIMHNTIVKKDDPCILYTGSPVYNCVYRNNLFIGGGKRAFDFDAAMIDCDFDYDGFGGGPWDIFMKWNRVRYATFDEAKAKSPVERHMTLVDAATAFANGAERPTDVNKQFDPATIDLRLKEGSAAVDAGEAIPGLDDGFKGKAPDLGAYELGDELPHYGPRPEKPADSKP